MPKYFVSRAIEAYQFVVVEAGSPEEAKEKAASEAYVFSWETEIKEYYDIDDVHLDDD